MTGDNDMGISRLGISVSKKTGNAVVRNRIKRHIREAFRRTPCMDRFSRDFIFVIKGPGRYLDSKTIREEIGSLLCKLE